MAWSLSIALGLFWALGALAALWILRLELKRYGYDPEIAASVLFAAAIAGLLGARLLLILEEWESFTQAPFELLFSGAGFSWYGGLFSGALAAAWVFKKHKLPLPQAADMNQIQVIDALAWTWLVLAVPSTALRHWS